MISFTVNFRPWCWAVVLLSGLAGCVGPGSVPPEQINRPANLSALSGVPPALVPFYIRSQTCQPRNKTLFDMEAGLAALDQGENALAAETLDRVLNQIESVYANTEQAARARSLWHQEGGKIFKGEPYERVMAYYYRGLLHLRAGEYDSARACFKSGVLQDAFAEEEQNRCDFALILFLEGWAAQCMGDREMSQAAYQEVKVLRREFKMPDSNDNCLLIIETGSAPRKLADGVGHYELVYRRGLNNTARRARVSLDGNEVMMFPMEDIAWQAMSRGGRPVDRILRGKAVFRQTNAEMGSTIADLGGTGMVLAPLFNNGTASQMQGVSAALGLIGVAQMSIAMNANPRADTRYWHNLPDTVHVYTCHLPAQPHIAQVTFLGDDGQPVAGLERSMPIVFDEKGYGLGFCHSNSALSNASTEETVR